MKPIALAVALALTAAPLLSAPPALAAPAAKAATPASPAWVARSNALAQILLDAQGPFQPEETGFFGVPGYDDKVADLGGWAISTGSPGHAHGLCGPRRSGRAV